MQPEDIDKLFRERLEGHAPTPPAFLWDRLEAELQPERKKRPVLWLYATAAVLTLLLLAGGAWLMRTVPQLQSGPEVAVVQPTTPAAKAAQSEANPVSGLEKEISAGQATATPAPASYPSKALVAAAPVRAEQPAAARQTTSRPAAAAQRTVSEVQTVATVTPRAPQPERATPAPTTATSAPEPAPATLATTTSAQEPAAPLGIIEVEVRQQAKAAPVVAAAAPQRRPRLGSLFRQARNVLRGDQVSLADAGLPETVTVQARVAGHTLTKVIQL